MITKREQLKKRPRKAPAPTDVWADLERISRNIPPDEVARIPTDMSKNVDHYAYGQPKARE